MSAVCTRCGWNSCRWPNDCQARCKECGGPAGKHWADGCIGYCSQSCADADIARMGASGEIHSVSDTTPEQLNEMFQDVRLCLDGVSARNPS